MDPLSFVPDAVKQKISDSLVEFIADKTAEFVSSQAADTVRKLSSQDEFNQSINQAIQNAVIRFVAEYTTYDEDLVAVIRDDNGLWQSPSVQQAIVKLIRRPGAWLPDERESIVQHFADVLPQRVNRERVDKAVSFFLFCVAEELWSLPGAKEIREISALQFQKITAQATKEQVNLIRQQLEATKQLGVDIQQAFIQLSSAMEQKLLGAPTKEMVYQYPYHNLPNPDYARFVGRTAELEWLRQRLNPIDRAWQIAITGIGGTGKTALALAVAHEFRQRYSDLPKDERFEFIIWVSGKEQVLTPTGKEKAELPELVLRTLDDIYTAIARTMEREDITNAPIEQQSHLIQQALKANRTLLIMDNLESVQDDRIKPFLRHLPEPTKAIITSREYIDVADILRLTGLSVQEADELITAEATVRQVQLQPPQRQRIFELTQGLPLPIKLGIARIAGGESFGAIARWLGNAKGDLPEYCVKGQVDLAKERNPDAWRVLLTCSLFERNVGASTEALGWITDLSIADRDQALTQLQRLFLVNRTDNDRFWTLPIVQRYISAELAEADFRNVLIERWLDWLVNYAQKNGLGLEFHTEDIATFSLEYPNLLGAIRWCREKKKWDTLYKLSEGTWNYAYIVGLFNEHQEIVKAADEAAVNPFDARRHGRVQLQIGKILGNSGDYAQALAPLQEAAQAALNYGYDADLADAWRWIGHIYYELHQYESAEKMARQLLEKGEENKDYRFNFYAAYRFASVASARKDYDAALEWIDRAEQWAKELNNGRMLASILYRRAITLIKRDDYAAAEPFLLQALELNRSWGELRYIAYDTYRLAEVYLHTDRVSLARQFADEAESFFEHLGMVVDVEKIKQFKQNMSQHPGV